MADGRIEIDTRINNDGAEKGINDLQKKLKNVGDSIKTTGENMSKYVTLPLTAVGGAAMKTASDFDSAARKMQQSLGLTADEAKALSDLAVDLWAEGYGESLDQVSSALINVKQNMKNVADGDELQRVTRDAMLLSDIFDSDVNEVTRAGNNLMVNFGVSSEKAFDLMAHGAQNGLNFSQEMFDNLSEYAPLFADMGYSADEYFKLLEQGAAAGVYNLDYINDVMKEFQIRIKDGSKSTSDAMAQMSDDTNKVWESFLAGDATVKDVSNAVLAELEGMDDQVKANEIGVGLFGTKWEDLEADAMYALGGINGELENVDGTMSAIAESQEESFGQRLKETMRGVQEAIAPLGVILLDLAERVLPIVNEKIQQLSDWFNKLSPLGQNLAVVFGIILAAIGPVLVVIGSLISAVGNIIPVVIKVWGWLSKLGPVFTAIKTAMLAINPVFAIITVAVVALATLIYKNWDEIQAWTIETWGKVKDWLAQTWDSIKETSSKAWNAIKDFFVKYWDELLAVFTGPIGILVYFIANNWESIKETTSTVWNAIKDFFSNLWEGIKSVFNTVISGIVNFVVERWNNIKTNTTNIFNAVSNFLNTTWTTIKTTVSNLVEGVKNTVRDKFEALKQAVIEKMTGVKTKIEELWGKAQSFLEGIDLLQIGKDIIQGLINGITNKWESLKSKIEELANSMPQWMRDLLGIHSPSLVFKQISHFMMDGIILGINEKLSDVSNTMNDVVAAVTSKAADMVAAGLNLGQQFSKALTSSIKYSPPRDGGGTIGYNPDGSIAWNSVNKNKSSGGGGGSNKGKLVDSNNDGRIDYKQNSDGSKTHYAYDKFHNGGWVGNLRHDEIPAILQEGEYVLSRDDIANINSMMKKIPNLETLIPGLINGLNIPFSSNSSNVDNSRHSSVIVNAGLGAREIANETEKALNRMAFKMG